MTIKTPEKHQARCWSTVDELKWIKGVKSRSLSPRKLLESWLDTCHHRYWPISVDVQECYDAVTEMLEEMK